MAEMLVDSTKLDACLDAEADAIRAKTGDSNDIAFDFANNKGFADAIAAIPSGGGLPSPITKVTCGTYTPARATDAHRFTHDLGCYPTVFYVGIKQPYYVTTAYFVYNVLVGFASDGTTRANTRQETTNSINMQRGSNIVTVTNTTITINRTLSTRGQFQPTIKTNKDDDTSAIPVEYFWVAVATSDSYVEPQGAIT